MKRPIAAAMALACCLGADEAGKILRPADRSWFTKSPVDIVATVPEGGRIELDGQPLRLDAPFPNVYHGQVAAPPGEHKLALVWEGNRREVTFAVGVQAGFVPFRAHPPAGETACTQCHELSKRGRFRFKGGCLDCHAAPALAKSHKPHTHETLAECGMCHNAHGSTAAAHLLRAKEQACKTCHN